MSWGCIATCCITGGTTTGEEPGGSRGRGPHEAANPEVGRADRGLGGGPGGGKTLEADFFAGALRLSRGETPEQRQHWCASIYGEIRERAERTQGGLSIYAMCTGAGVSRAGFYRHWEAEAPDEAEMALRAAIQKMALAHRFYGYRRVRERLREGKRGYAVGSKEKVRRLLRRKTTLLAIRRRHGSVRTTDSDHGFRVYPNLAEHLELTQTNQLWVADPDIRTAARRNSFFWRWCWMRSLAPCGGVDAGPRSERPVCRWRPLRPSD